MQFSATFSIPPFAPLGSRRPLPTPSPWSVQGLFPARHHTSSCTELTSGPDRSRRLRGRDTRRAGHPKDRYLCRPPPLPSIPQFSSETRAPFATARAGRGNSKPGERQHGHRRGARGGGGGGGDAGEEGSRHDGAPRAHRLEEEGSASRPLLGRHLPTPISTRASPLAVRFGLGAGVRRLRLVRIWGFRARFVVEFPGAREFGADASGSRVSEVGWNRGSSFREALICSGALRP
jgi:hypothetical protein